MINHLRDNTVKCSPPPKLYQTNWFRGRFTSSLWRHCDSAWSRQSTGAQELTLLLYSQVSLREFEKDCKKLNELQALSIGNDLVFCVASWLNPNYLNCELIPSSADFTIYRRDRKNRRGGGVFLAVKNRLPSIRRRDLETDAEILACELRPDSRRKILAVVFYRPQDTDLEYLKQLKKTLLLASKAKFDQILVI